MLATALSLVLAFGTLAAADAARCRADGTPAAVSSAAPAPDAAAAPQPGSEEEERAYARREAESPGAEKFAGGFIGFLILVALVVIIILLVQKG
jgi:hypothetical protein